MVRSASSGWRYHLTVFPRGDDDWHLWFLYDLDVRGKFAVGKEFLEITNVYLFERKDPIGTCIFCKPVECVSSEDLFRVAGADEDNFFKGVRKIRPEFGYVCDAGENYWCFEGVVSEVRPSLQI